MKTTPRPWHLSKSGDSIKGPDGLSVCCASGNIKRPHDERLGNLAYIVKVAHLFDDMAACLANLYDRGIVMECDGDAFDEVAELVTQLRVYTLIPLPKETPVSPEMQVEDDRARDRNREAHSTRSYR